MKNPRFHMFRSLTSLFCILLLVLIQFPALALASGSEGFIQAKNLFDFSAYSEALFSDDAVASPAVVFSNATTITVTDRATGANSPNGISNPYPSVIPVSGLSGTISNITVTLNGLTTARPRDIDVVVVAPGGQNLILMSDTGDLTATSNINLTFSDAASSFLPTTDGSVIVGGTFKPTDRAQAIANNDVFPAPGPAAVTYPGPAGTGAGTATLASVFNGSNPNGNWNLYVIDDSLGGGNSTISGGWSLDITVAGAVAATTTAVTSSLNPSLTTQSVTFTATVVSGGNPVTAGTVSFTQNGTAIAGCTNVAVNGSGQATCTAAAGTLPEGTLNVVATYNGTTSFGASSGSVSQRVNSPTVVTANQFCNNGGIAFPDNGAAAQYPSNIAVTGLTGTISKVTVNLNNFTSPRTQDIDLLLVAPSPGAQALQILSDVGNTTAVTGVNLVLDDAAATTIPIGTTLVSGTYRPTDNAVVGADDTYPSPAPATYNSPAPAGAATFASVYNGINPNGTWSLYAMDDALGGGAGSIGGYCLNFTLNKFTTTTTVTSSLNPSILGNSVTFTATVTSAGGVTPSGSVQFFDGATSLGTATLNASGVATLTTAALSTGTHTITAQYLGANVGAGGGGFVASTSNGLSQVVIGPTAADVTVGGRVLSATGRGIPRAIVTITDVNGNVRSAMTNPFGFYRFNDISVAQSYIFSVRSKNKRFGLRVLNVNEENEHLDFVEIQ